MYLLYELNVSKVYNQRNKIMKLKGIKEVNFEIAFYFKGANIPGVYVYSVVRRTGTQLYQLLFFKSN